MSGVPGQLQPVFQRPKGSFRCTLQMPRYRFALFPLKVLHVFVEASLSGATAEPPW